MVSLVFAFPTSRTLVGVAPPSLAAFQENHPIITSYGRCNSCIVEHHGHHHLAHLILTFIGGLIFVSFAFTLGTFFSKCSGQIWVPSAQRSKKYRTTCRVSSKDYWKSGAIYEECGKNNDLNAETEVMDRGQEVRPTIRIAPMATDAEAEDVRVGKGEAQ